MYLSNISALEQRQIEYARSQWKATPDKLVGSMLWPLDQLGILMTKRALRRAGNSHIKPVVTQLKAGLGGRPTPSHKLATKDPETEDFLYESAEFINNHGLDEIMGALDLRNGDATLRAHRGLWVVEDTIMDLLPDASTRRKRLMVITYEKIGTVSTFGMWSHKLQLGLTDQNLQPVTRTEMDYDDFMQANPVFDVQLTAKFVLEGVVNLTSTLAKTVL